MDYFNSLLSKLTSSNSTCSNHVCCYSVVSDSLQLHGLQHARLPCPSQCPTVCSDSCPLNWLQYLTVLSSAAPFFFYLQSLPASESFPMSWLSASGGQSIEVLVSQSQTKLRWLSCFMHAHNFSISPSNEYLGLISLRIDWFDLLDVQETQESSLAPKLKKHQFFHAQPSLWFNSYNCTWQVKP